MKLFPNEQVAPLKDVDTFWHYHILDTMSYAADCEHIFGYFLHHLPYLGMGDEDDQLARISGGERMRELYEQTFGESYTRADSARDAAANGHTTAFCGVAEGPLTGQRHAAVTDSAFCGVARGARAAAEPAFCGVARPGAELAFCGVAGPSAEPAFCGVAHPRAELAFCGVASPPPGISALLQIAGGTAEVAFCGVQAGGTACAGSVQGPAKQRAVGKPRREAQVQRRLRR